MTQASYQPRCKVCRHSERGEIDLLLATQHPYVRIEEKFGVPYRSLANHLHKHLNFEEPTIKKAVEGERAAFSRVYELGVEVAIEHRLMLDSFIEGYYRWLVSAD